VTIQSHSNEPRARIGSLEKTHPSALLWSNRRSTLKTAIGWKDAMRMRQLCECLETAKEAFFCPLGGVATRSTVSAPAPAQKAPPAEGGNSKLTQRPP
jgi:hypothetical protein